MRGQKLRALLGAMIEPQIVRNAIRVSLFVGTCLNVINQGPAIWRGAGVEWGKFMLNFAVPYLVATYSAAKARKGMEG